MEGTVNCEWNFNVKPLTKDDTTALKKKHSYQNSSVKLMKPLASVIIKKSNLNHHSCVSYEILSYLHSRIHVHLFLPSPLTFRAILRHFVLFFIYLYIYMHNVACQGTQWTVTPHVCLSLAPASRRVLSTLHTIVQVYLRLNCAKRTLHHRVRRTTKTEKK